MKRGLVLVLVLVFLLSISFVSAIQIEEIYQKDIITETREESITRYIYGFNGLVAS
ncbi:hypothetical protein HOD61_01410, partial [archaeon]|nr:hypothetical protein [archaeon]